MSYTNKTPNYDLPQWIGTDKPTFLGDFNGAFSAIDTAIKNASDSATSAASTANAASATATSANTNANTALTTANNAKDTADAATSAAAAATAAANTATSTANSAAHAALGNNIANLAPAYDPTLTYAVGDLVTYIDENNSGKLYKCIVAVNVPGAFNINYWDDVTTSEVYDRARASIKVGDYTVSNTVADALSDAIAALTQYKHLISARTKIIEENASGGITTYDINYLDKTEGTYAFTRAITSMSGLAVITLRLHANSNAKITCQVTGTPAASFTNDINSNFESNTSFYIEF